MDTMTSAVTTAPMNPARRDVSLAADFSLGVAPSSASAAKVAQQGMVSVESAHSAVEAFKALVQDIQRNLDFSVDDSTGQVVVKVIDGDSGKLIRQIPSEELLRLSERLEDMRSLLFKAQA